MGGVEIRNVIRTRFFLYNYQIKNAWFGESVELCHALWVSLIIVFSLQCARRFIGYVNI